MWFKRTIPLILVFVLGVLAFVHNYVPHPLANQFREEMTSWFKIIGGFGLFIGAYSLLHLHLTRIRRKQPGWAFSVFVYIGAISMIALGLWNEGLGPFRATPKEVVTWFDWGFENIQVPAQATIFSILAFFMASAAFRTFRARNLGASLLLAAALVVMFGRVPVSEAFGRLLGAPNLFTNATKFLMKYANLAAKRGILLGIALGMISQSLRVLFGIERSYMGGGS